MKVHELIVKLKTMPKDLDIVVWNSREEYVIATEIKLKSLHFGNGDLEGCIDWYHHPKLDMTKRDIVIIE